MLIQVDLSGVDIENRAKGLKKMGLLTMKALQLKSLGPFTPNGESPQPCMHKTGTKCDSVWCDNGTKALAASNFTTSIAKLVPFL